VTFIGNYDTVKITKLVILLAALICVISGGKKFPADAADFRRLIIMPGNI
jgi:hypothetical protein